MSLSKLLIENKINRKIGIMSVTEGATSIEQWMVEKVPCSNTLNVPSNLGKRIMKLTNMTIKGWIWYQAEHNCIMNYPAGNETNGYYCMLSHLIKTWRKKWSVNNLTTPEISPFGIVTLHPFGCWLGGSDVSAFVSEQSRIIQNIPNTFLAHTYDLSEKYRYTCIRNGCCLFPRIKKCNEWLNRENRSNNACVEICEVEKKKPFIMPNFYGLHPRNKQMIGKRLAINSFDTVYKLKNTSVPFIQSCSLKNNTLVIYFNVNLNEHRVNKRKFDKSTLQILTNESNYCFQPMVYCEQNCNNNSNRYWKCPGLKLPPRLKPSFLPTGNYFETNWYTIKNDQMFAIKNRLIVHHIKSTTIAIRYAWNTLCCNSDDVNPCEEERCPLMSSLQNQPVTPFKIMLKNGICIPKENMQLVL
jgi:hypothetical protein